MDNLAHTLLGAALGEAGLRRKTGLALPVLMIAANLPDVDAVAVLFEDHLALRRGWSHGPIGLALLPLLLAFAVTGFDRWQRSRGTRPADRAPVRFGWVLALAYIGAVSHPLLDFLNTYGIRCLMPFSDQWFYGDALFIIDVWMWSALALGIALARRRRKQDRPNPARPALLAIVFVGLYTLAMGVSGAIAERLVERELIAAGHPRPVQVLAAPVPVDPFRRRIVHASDTHYGFGEIRWTPRPRIALDPEAVPINMDDPAIRAAATQDRAVAAFLYWSRFPFAAVERDAGEATVTIGDARYTRRPGDGRFQVQATVPDPGGAPGP